MTNDTPQSSPLDPFLSSFLQAIARRDTGFTPGPESNHLAEELGQPRAFIDMLLTSARTRGLIKPAYGRGNKVMWTVSPTGQALIEREGSDLDPASTER